MRKLVFVFALLVGGAAAHAEGGPLAAERAQIKAGIQSGQLTRREVQLLRRMARRIVIMHKDFAADGVVSPGEQQIAEQVHARAAARIAKLLTNGEVRRAR